MPFEVRGTRPNATLDVMVGDAATGRPRRLIVLSGVAEVAPADTGGGGIRVTVVGSGSAPEPVGFYVPGCDPLPAGDQGVSITGEASLAQLRVVAYESHEARYGIGDVSATLYADQNQGGVQWPYLGFVCYGNRAMEVAYRVTMFGGEDPRTVRLTG